MLFTSAIASAFLIASSVAAPHPINELGVMSHRENLVKGIHG